MKSTALHQLFAIGLAALVATLAACGGGGGGVGSGGTGQAMSAGSGTVTGLASVIVDGIEFDDTHAEVLVEVAPGTFQEATVSLGQSVEVQYRGEAEAQTIRIDAAVVGPVTSVDAGAGRLQTMGQTVIVNDSADTGPITVFTGVGGLAALNAGDAVEIHGVPRWNGTGYQIHATRIERLAALPARLRVSGIVQDLGATGFVVGGLTVQTADATVVPAATTLADGQRVVVWAAQPAAGTALVAQGVRVIERRGTAQAPAYLGGVVSRFDGAARRFDVAGVSVRYGDATHITPRGPQFQLGDGVYVQVTGTYGAGGGLDATRIKIRKTGADGFVQVELAGEITDFAGVASFRLRGAQVDASALSAPYPGCGNVALGNGRRVTVEGGYEARTGGSVVVASRLRCLN